MKKIIGSVLALAIGLSACGSGKTHQSAQAAATDTSKAGVSQMASGFRNVSYKCIEVGGAWFAVFSASDGGNHDNLAGSIAAVPDPSCKGFGP